MTDSQLRKIVEHMTDLQGMTVNERLYLTGVMDEFEKALVADKERARSILKLLMVDDPSINKILEN